jgi:hypothetical protein
LTSAENERILPYDNAVMRLRGNCLVLDGENHVPQRLVHSIIVEVFLREKKNYKKKIQMYKICLYLGSEWNFSK